MSIDKSKQFAKEVTDNFKIKIGKELRQARIEKGVSLDQLAKELGLGVTTISELEKGYNLPKLETVVYLSYYLSVSIKEVLTSTIAKDANVRSSTKITNEPIYEEKLNYLGIEALKTYRSFLLSQPKYQRMSVYQKRKLTK